MASRCGEGVVGAFSVGCMESRRITRQRNTVVARKNDVLRSGGARRKSREIRRKDAAATRKTGSWRQRVQRAEGWAVEMSRAGVSGGADAKLLTY
jgi:hypothetical protein